MEYTANNAQGRLPQELVDSIIDHLWDDHATLNACALVSPNWWDRSRMHVFRKVCLKPTSPPGTPAACANGNTARLANGASDKPKPGPAERCRALHTLLHAKPRLAEYVQDLEIWEGALGLPRTPGFVSSLWATTEITLAKLFTMLTHVRRLDFSGMSPVYWRILPPTFQSALATLFRRESLTYVRLHSWVFPSVGALAELLRHGAHLRAVALYSTNVNGESPSDNGPDLGLELDALQEPALTLPGVSASEEGEGAAEASAGVEGAGQQDSGSEKSLQVDAPAVQCLPPLEVLTMDYVTFPAFDQWVQGYPELMDITSLRELRVAHFPDPEVIDRLLCKVGPSLEYFHLKPGAWQVRPFSLSRNTGLKSLRVTLDDPATAIRWAVALMMSISADNTALESVEFEFYFDVKKIANGAWSELDAVFEWPIFASLRRIDVGLWAIPAHPDFISVQREMSSLSSRGDTVRWYQLATPSHRNNRHLTPLLSQYESRA
ncbi:hypothetical protein D9619_011589 [Psilocybe cf. subviscida]|uniref:Uncharacterized protein n=1 Tax=Psilocybe cf. subviscida TaxID=2480587 RepID=A0A8H5FA29_9AGAR|nr:hypothetical protein D9619_011589 [Psilocybe cf. subviscida]